MVKFDRSAIIDLLECGDFEYDSGDEFFVEFRISGDVAGTFFEGSDWIIIIKPGKK